MNGHAPAFTLEQLTVLECIAKEGSFSAAARVLRRSTPSVSYVVQGLEQQLDMPLFDRSGHKAKLNAEGRFFLREARLLLREARELQRLAEQLRKDWEAELHLVVDGLLPTPPLMRALQRLTDLGAPTRLRLSVEYLSGVQERFEKDEAELMVALDYRESSPHPSTPLPKIGMYLVAHRDHRLFQQKHPLPVEALTEYVELVVAASGAQPERGAARLWQGSPQLFQVSDFHTKKHALLHCIGFGWMPRHLIEGELAAGILQPLPLSKETYYAFQPHLVIRQSRKRRKAAHFFADCLIAEWPQGERTDP